MSMAPAGQPKAAQVEHETAGRPHLVVVRTRAIDRVREPEAPGRTVLLTRFWHPRDRTWSTNYFESLEHALRLFVDESGWRLMQQQALDAPHRHELVFEARRADFTRPSTEDLLREIGMTPATVADLLDHPERGTGEEKR
jgi:hypothetical protein